MKKNIIISIIVLIIVFVSFLFFYDKNLPDNDSIEQNNDFVTLIYGDVSVTAEIADDIPKQRLGLSGRTVLSEGIGMLFIFENDDFHGIWMKDMLFSIDIIWLDKNLTIIDFERNISPETYPEIFKPHVRSRYVLEINAGFVNKHNIEIGNIFIFQNNTKLEQVITK